MKHFTFALSTLALALGACSTSSLDTLPSVSPFDLPPHLARTVEIAHDPTDPYVLIEAHRGCFSTERPENTLPSLEHCITIGADWIEIDVALTKDKQLVLMHDKTLDRTTTLSGKTTQYTLAEITNATILDDAGNPTNLTPPSLSDALDLMANRIMFRLDLKCGNGCLDQVYDMVEAKGLLDQAVVPERARRRLISAGLTDDQIIVVGANIEAIGSPDQIPAHVDHVQVKDFKADNPPIELMAQFEPETRMIAFPYSDDRSGGHGDKASESDPDSGWGWLIDHGIDMFLTDHPDAAIAYLESRGLRNREAISSTN